MPTTSNFGWNTPADTDLVKDGALAIRTLGNNIDASMAELKGGTTGQVLSKTSNTDMDFTWVTQDDANAIQNAIVDAKGDLVAATANDTPARLAVGSNGDTLVADSAATTGLRWQSVNTGNFVVNGLFDNWQRGTSGTFTSSLVYPAVDRFFAVCTGTAPTCTMSRQTADTTNLQYGLRFGRNSGQTNTGSPWVGTALETGTTKLLAGQTITVSLYIKRGADAPTNLTVGLYTSTGTDQSAAGIFSGTWASAAYAFQTAQATTTTMTRYSFTTTLGSTINQVALLCSYAPTGTAGSNEWFQIEGVQIEVGSVATAVRRSGGTIQGELAAAMRYYQRYNSSGTFRPFGVGVATGTTAAVIMMPLAVPMRAEPTSIDYGATLALADGVNALVGVNTVTGSLTSSQVMEVSANVTSGLTQYRTYRLVSNNSAAAYVGFNAEL